MDRHAADEQDGEEVAGLGGGTERHRPGEQRHQVQGQPGQAEQHPARPERAVGGAHLVGGSLRRHHRLPVLPVAGRWR